LVLIKIDRFDATSCWILRLICTKFDFRWGYVPDTAGGAYRAPPSYIYGEYFWGGGKARDREREGREGVSEKRGSREGRDKPTPNILA